MSGLFGKYLARNAVHYRKKYALVFALILLLGFCLTLTSYFYAGEIENSIRYARAMGDIQLDIDYDANDISHDELSRDDKVAMHDDLVDHFMKANPYRFYEISIVPGKVMSGATCESISMMDFAVARDVYGVTVYRGKEPGPGEVCLPKNLEKTIAVGDAVSFVYKDSDQVYGSETFTVGGFYPLIDACEGMAFIEAETITALDPGRIPQRFVAFDAPREEILPLMTKEESVARKESLETIIAERFGDIDFVRAHAELRSAYDNYLEARDIIDFFLVVLAVFIACLCVVSSISIVNVLFVTVIDRIRIIGMMFSFGLGRKRGIMLLSAEILAFAVIASAVGIALATAAAVYVSKIPIKSGNDMLATLLGEASTLPMLIGWKSVALTLVAGVVIPFVVSSLSIRKIVKGEIIGLIQQVR